MDEIVLDPAGLPFAARDMIPSDARGSCPLAPHEVETQGILGSNRSLRATPAETGTHPSHAGLVIKDLTTCNLGQEWRVAPPFFPVLGPENHAREPVIGLPLNFNQAETVAGSTLTPLPWVDEMAIFLT